MKKSSKILNKLINIQKQHPFEDIIISCFSLLQIQFYCWCLKNNCLGGNGRQRKMNDSLFIVFTIIIICVNTIIYQRHSVFRSDSLRVVKRGFCGSFVRFLKEKRFNFASKGWKFIRGWNNKKFKNFDKLNTEKPVYHFHRSSILYGTYRQVLFCTSLHDSQANKKKIQYLHP